MNSLTKIQKISRIFYILSRIAFVCSIVGCALSLVGAVCVGVWGDNQALMDLLADYGEYFDKNTALCYCICGTIMCGFYIAIYVLVKNFYAFELKMGTPFDFAVSQRLRKLGWLNLILTICGSMICEIVASCFDSVLSMFDLAGVTIGIVYVVVSYILEHGAEIKNVAITKTMKDIENSANSTEEKE